MLTNAATLFEAPIRAPTDNEAPAKAPSKAPEDLEVHVKLTRTGAWHRKAIGGATTACGHVLGGYAVREESYEGQLCRDGCFTAYELAQVPPVPERRP